MKINIEISEYELLLLTEAVMFEYLFDRDRSKKDSLLTLSKKLASYYPIDETKKPTIKQFESPLKPYDDIRKSIKFVAFEEAVENLYEIELNVYERLICTTAMNKSCDLSKTKNKDKDEKFVYSLPEFTLWKKFVISNRKYRDMVSSIYKIKMTKDEIRALSHAIFKLKVVDIVKTGCSIPPETKQNIQKKIKEMWEINNLSL